MQKQEKEKQEKAKDSKETDFDPRSLVGYKTKDMADAYGVSPKVYNKSIAAIKDKIEAERQRICPGSKKGTQNYNLVMVVWVVEHLGPPKKK
ncbi:MAG: hypothetical protein AB7G44_14805 [Bacteroidia bacterium]